MRCSPAPMVPSDATALPDWIRRRAPRGERPAAALSPSDLGGAKALPGETDFATEEESKRRGRQLHLLLEHLPERPRESWPEVARDLLATGPDRTDAAEADALRALVTPVLDRLDEMGFLGPDTLAEVEITATLPELENQRIHGTIDRLRVTPDLVSVLDYKSNAVLPGSAEEVPLGLVRQLAAYRAALRQIYPGRRIECLLVWTRSATLTRLDDAQMDAALRTAPAS